MNRNARALVLSVCLLAAVVLASCAKGTEGVDAPEREPFELAVEQPLDANLIGIVTGIETGVFEDAGFDLTVTVADEPGAAVRDVAAGRADLAISEGPEVVLARDGGLDVVAVGAVVDRPLASLIWLPRSGIRRPADLRGAAVALADRPLLATYLDVILTRAGVPRDSVRRLGAPEGLAATLLTGRADATLGGSRNIEGVELRSRGSAPTMITVDELGIPPYDELTLVASGAALEQESESVRLFLAALERGTAAAASDPTAAARDLVAIDPSIEAPVARDQVESTLDLLEPVTPEQPFAWIDREGWQVLIAWMRDRELIGSLPDASEMVTNEYLPTGPPEND